MDGKQARNTGCCSSLGLILDHGCDGFNMGCSVLIFVKLVQCGDSIWTLLTVTTSGWGFYVSTLEHFYIGSHFMGPGNMASDGAVLVFLLFGSMGIFGNDYWTSYLIKSHEFTFSDAFNLIFTITGIINVAGYCLSIIKHSYKKIEPGEITGHALHGGMFVIQVFGYTIPIVLTSALLFIGESPLINQKQVEGDVSPFYIVMLTQLFLLGHMNFALIMRHVTK
jgi:phosphatidylglycerophosphate synthase